jgi:transposase
MKTKLTKKDFDKMFHTNDDCLEWIKNQQYPNGVYCPICNKITKHHKFAKRPVYECDYCGHQISPLATTIFRKSSTPLRVWFGAIYEMATTRSGYSAMALQRKYGVTYKTAWRMFKQIRKLLDEQPNIFCGEVEVDETYVGGARHGTRGRGASGKTPVFGIVERQGKVMTSVVADTKRSTVTPIITKNVSKDAIVYSDEFPTYDHLTYIGFNHHRINHRAKQYVSGRVHTNSIEGFWSQFKRSVSGVYHSVSPKYLQSYLNEYAFRYNHRNDEIPMIQSMLNQIVS